MRPWFERISCNTQLLEIEIYYGHEKVNEEGELVEGYFLDV